MPTHTYTEHPTGEQGPCRHTPTYYWYGCQDPVHLYSSRRERAEHTPDIGEASAANAAIVTATHPLSKTK